MQLTTILLTVFCLTVGARTLSQSITFSGKNVQLKKVFEVIKNQTGFFVTYEIGDLKNAHPVTVSVRNMPLEQFLKKVLTEQPLDYSLENTTISIEKKKPAGDLNNQLSPVLETPPITVRGRVVNEKGEPVSASVVIKGTKTGTTTDSHGSFEIQNVEDKSILVISAVGYEAQEIKFFSENISVTLKVTESKLDEVVFKGYYSTSNRLNTGNVSTVKAKEIETSPVSNALAALQGRVAGVNIVQENGMPGGQFTVRIRGQNSIANGNNPLYVIDGVPLTSNTQSNTFTSSLIYPNGTNPLNALNLGDIERVEVLKDADATAIYGSRGANGVILITTKKGKAGKTKLEFNYYTGVSNIAKKVDLLDTKEYIAMREEAFNNASLAPESYDYDVNGSWDRNKYTDWQKLLIGNQANINNAQISVSGGNTNTKFTVGGSYRKEKTVMLGENSDIKKSAHFNLNNVSENNKFEINIFGNFSNVSSNFINRNYTNLSLTLPPNSPGLYDSTGDVSWDPSIWSFPYNLNPAATQKTGYDNQVNTLIAGAVFGYKIISSLQLKLNLGYSSIGTKTIMKEPSSIYGPVFSQYIPNTSLFSDGSFQSTIIEPQIDFAKSVQRGKFSLLLGTTFLQQKTTSVGQEATGFINESLMKDIKSAATVRVLNSINSQYKYNGVYARVNYVHDEKYIVNLTGRRDGSSRFGPGNQFANFGAVGFGWIFSSEHFLKDKISFISFGKLRTSYGTSGNDQLQDYAYLDTYTTGIPYLNMATLNPSRLYNPDFAWEQNKKFEIGVELGFLKNRISLSASFYKNRSGNQLVGYPLPPATGFVSLPAYNFPATVQNQGQEFELSSSNINTKNISWTSSINFSSQRNKLVSYEDIENSSYANVLVVGKPIGVRKLFHFTGVNTQTGIYEFEDANKDGVFNNLDLTSIKEVGIKFFGGLQNNFQYKDFQLSFLLQFVKQSGNSYIFNYGPPGFFGNQLTHVLNRWRNPGDQSEVQSFNADASYANAYYMLQQSDAGIVDASFIRLKNVSFSYNLPVAWTQKCHLQFAKLFIEGQNLATLTNYVGGDPEYQLGNIQLPPLRTFVAGINLAF